MLIMLMLILASPATAQPLVLDPASAYVTAGQDEPGYRVWVSEGKLRPMYVKAFNDYLRVNGVGGVVPTWQLLRTASDWQKCSAEPFEVPPTRIWPNIVAALRFIGTYVEPVIGPVEPVSVYRNPILNQCAGGAPESVHQEGGAIDMVPLWSIDREDLMTKLCQIYLRNGSWNNIGLGVYRGVRFHIDARKFREWGTSGVSGALGCNAVLAEGAQPFVPEPATPTLSPGFKIVVPPPPTDPLAPKH